MVRGRRFAAIAIGALVPAAIMSIACANLFTRNIYREYLNPDCTAGRRARWQRWCRCVVKLGALVFVIGLPRSTRSSCNCSGGILIIQTLPSVLIGLYTRWLNPHALLAGWAEWRLRAALRCRQVSALPRRPTAWSYRGLPIPCYAALLSLLLNLAVSAALSFVFNAFAGRGADATVLGIYRYLCAVVRFNHLATALRAPRGYRLNLR